MNKADSIFKIVFDFLTNRVLFLIVAICALFYLLSLKLFDLQIIHGQEYLESLNTTIARDVPISAQRGNIYDRYGRPLAINQFAYSVVIDPSITMNNEEKNKVILDLVSLLESNGEEFIDELPISVDEPYEFTFYEDDEEKTKETSWKENKAVVGKDLSVDETLDVLRERFEVDKKHTNADARKIIAIRLKLWLVRYYSFNSVTIAANVCLDTVTKIEEDTEKYKSIDVEKEAMRYYPEGKYMSHVVGYIGRIGSEENLKELIKYKGYSPSDLIGKGGIELAFEDNLRGTDGELAVIVNTAGRKVSEIEGSRINPIQGDKIFLTIDAELQRECYEILYNLLKEEILAKLQTNDPKAKAITPTELLSSLIKANNISAKDVFESTYGSVSFTIKDYVLSVDPEADTSTNAGRVAINKIISEGVEEEAISVRDALLLLFEQGIITGDEPYLNRVKTGGISVRQVIVDKITEDEITPQMANVDPSTGSLVVMDPKTGDILACPTYPTYDNNDFITNMNTVYPKLLNDPTKPLINRPFMEGNPPGSTFKMISAVTALESGSINPNTLIYDEVKFKKAGYPEPECWNKAGHGNINVEQALEGSCNYFFFESIYRLGNMKDDNKLESITALNNYMSLFGLDENSGVEAGETPKEKSPMNISSPMLKETLYADRDESGEWFDGNTIHTAIGQGFSRVTPAVMARYISIVANKGDKYNLHLLNKIVTDGEMLEYVPKHVSIHDEISDGTWNILHEGMYGATYGDMGTARKAFAGFPISVASKTGTAEHGLKNRPDHISYAGFAPYDDPQVVVYVALPFSDTTLLSAAPASLVARDVFEAYFKLNAAIQPPTSVNTIAQ